MFDVYAFATPNSVKAPIALEKRGLEDRLRPSLCARLSRRRRISRPRLRAEALRRRPI